MSTPTDAYAFLADHVYLDRAENGEDIGNRFRVLRIINDGSG